MDSINRPYTNALIDHGFTRIYNYLSKTNVQLSETYSVSQTSTQLYNAGYKAAAKFINASPDEVCKSNTMHGFLM